jgi:hypothetical protein
LVVLLVSATIAHDRRLPVYQPLTASPTAQYGFFSSGVDSGSGGRQEIASGFTITSDAQVVDAQWDGAYRFGTTPSGATAFLIRFFADSNSLPGALISQQDVTATGVLTGFDNSAGLPILAYDSTISPVFVQCGKHILDFHSRERSLHDVHRPLDMTV